MISILIPVYNISVTKLVFSLHELAIEEKIKFEIILIDDCSSIKYRRQNRELDKLSYTTYIELEKNVGRSIIRNMLVEKAQYDCLLFMDCDAAIKDKSFIKHYIKHWNNATVICGGTAYGTEPVFKDYFLRWYYGVKREQRFASERNKAPNCSFSTFNFMIPKQIFNEVGFDESISRYGHEDTLFGYKLERKGYMVKHIDNPLIHLGLDENKDFVFKTKQGIRNLYLISIDEKYKEYDFSKFRILQLYKLLHKLRISRFIGLLYKLFHVQIERNLTSKNPKLLYLDLLKLGYLCTH